MLEATADQIWSKGLHWIAQLVTWKPKHLRNGFNCHKARDLTASDRQQRTCGGDTGMFTLTDSHSTVPQHGCSRALIEELKGEHSKGNTVLLLAKGRGQSIVHHKPSCAGTMLPAIQGEEPQDQ